MWKGGEFEMKKDFIVRRSITMVEGKPHVETYSEQELVLCKDCVYWDEECTEECDNSDSVCYHNGRCKPDWFCADGKRRDDDG